MYSPMVVVIGSHMAYQEDMIRILTQDLLLTSQSYHYSLPHYSEFLKWIHRVALYPTHDQSVLVVRQIHQSNEYHPDMDPTWYWFNIRLIIDSQPFPVEYHVYVYYHADTDSWEFTTMIS